MSGPSVRSTDVARVVEWASQRSLGPVWRELHRRMGASDRAVKSISVDLDDAAAAALTSLLGRASRLPRGKQKVSVAKLQAALGLDDAELCEVLERLVGPLENRARARAEAKEERERLWQELEARIGDIAPRTLERMRIAGDIETSAAPLLWVADLLGNLPLESPTPLPILAWDHRGDPHGLDSNRIAQRWLLCALAERAGVDPEDAATHELRDIARAAGIVFDRLSTPTLTWALRAEPSTPAGRLLEVGAAAGVPIHLASAVLDRGVPALRCGQVLCVENPSVVEWLHLTDQRVPTVCTSGWPSLDAQRLVAQLGEAGVRVHYAGDYDRSGLEIADFMRERFGVEVRMTADAYRAARREPASAWEDEVPQTPWCPELARAIRDLGIVVYQEDPAVRAGLIAAVAAD